MTANPLVVGPYRIERMIGRGGMGVVYLARDSRLDRLAALKALPDDVASDPDRLQRFEREAKALAALTHPNVAGIYGVEEADGRRYLALEYVDGMPLSERLAQGRLPAVEAIALAAQVAAGIEAAHEAGIIHRDLKPGNVVVTASDQVKVVDFGLAKGRVAQGASPSDDAARLRDSPTLANTGPTSPATLPGIILGTASYLSPEQARGKPVDRRTDIWSFGCLLYECLAGQQAFQGETPSDTIARILERQPDWTRLPWDTPRSVRALLVRCLEKDPKRRLRDIGEARLVLENPSADASFSSASLEAAPPPLAKKRRARPFAVVAAILAAFGLGAGLDRLVSRARAPGPIAPSITHLSLQIPDSLEARGTQITPDGRTLILRADVKSARLGGEPLSRLYVRRMDSPEFVAIRGTDRVVRFFLDPSGKQMAFASRMESGSETLRLFRMPIDGASPPMPVFDLPNEYGSDGLWMESGSLAFSVNEGRSFVEVPLATGIPSEPRSFNASGKEVWYLLDALLPNDRGFLLRSYRYESGRFRHGIAVHDLRTGETKSLLEDGGHAQLDPSGHLLFSIRETLFGVPFDLNRLEVTGSPVGLRDGLLSRSAWSHSSGFDYSPAGVLILIPGGFVLRDRSLVVITKDGQVSEWSDARAPIDDPFGVSRDGSRLLFTAPNAKAIYDLWISDRGSSSSRRLIGVEGADCGSPIFSADGQWIAFCCSGWSSKDGVYVARADDPATSRMILRDRPGSRDFMNPVSWLPDGSGILVERRSGDQSFVAFFNVPAPGDSARSLESLVPVPGSRGEGRFSPDGELLAYTSDESGRSEVYVVRFAEGLPQGEPVLASVGGGSVPRWELDGRSIGYVGLDEVLRESAIARETRLVASPPVERLDLRAHQIAGGLYDFLPDGSIVAVRQGAGEGSVKALEVTLGYDHELRERMRAAAPK